MVDMFKLVLPEKVAASVVEKDVKLICDPDSAVLTASPEAPPLTNTLCMKFGTKTS
jgi:hypothetical protein